jgi:hypothetical protein
MRPRSTCYVEQDRGRKPSTLRGYRSVIEAHLLPAFGEMPVEDVTTEVIESWIAAYQLRCEQLRAQASRDPKRHALRAIHHQLGMAGWAASTELPPQRRQAVLRDAHHHSIRPTRHPVAEHALTEVVIEAEDALAAGLGHAQHSEHLDLAHAPLLHAMDLLHAHLYR